MLLVLEIAATVVVVAVVVFAGLDPTVERVLARVGGLPGETARDAAEVLAAAGRAKLQYAGGIAALLSARLVAARRRESVAMPALVPAVALATGMGLVLQWGYDDVLRAEGDFYTAPGFAPGVLWGGLAAAAILLVPWDLVGRIAAAILPRLRSWGHWLLAAAAVGGVVALGVAGEGPAGSGAKVNLGPIQPIELVKLAAVAFFALLFARRAEELRYQRARRSWLQVPRPRYLVPALGVLLGIFAGMVLIGDLGPTLILAVVFVALYYAVTHSWAEVLLLAVLVVGFVVWVASVPPWLPGNVATRIEMWQDPWMNGHPGGDQLGRALWAFAAGGFAGRGPGEALLRSLPAGHTDLILAHLAEVGGLRGLLLYLTALAGVIGSGVWIGRHNRTPQRMLLAYALAWLLFAQLLVIFFGSTGLLPLTGVVVPFLSFGKTSMVVFLALVGILLRLGVGGRLRAESDELAELRRGMARGAVALAVGLLALGGAAWARTVVDRGETSTSAVLVMGGDETVFLRYDPRLTAIAERIRRGEILDRRGEPLAATAADGARSYPLGEALGTLLGPVDPGIVPPAWAVEGLLDDTLRGLDPQAEPLAVWIERRPGDWRTGRDRILFTVDTEELREEDRERAERLKADARSELFFTRVRRLDLSPLVPLAQRRGAGREEAITRFTDDVASRTVRLTIDGALQEQVAAIVRKVAAGRYPAAAAVVLDVDSGQVLARVQWPDYDPGRPETWKEEVLGNDRRFLGSYGPWRDKTGLGGLYQAGSIFKVFTSLAWVREGLESRGTGCAVHGEERFPCTERNPRRNLPSFTLPHWSQPIHDSHRNSDGVIELTEALEVSCNVFFAQLGLALGPEPLAELAADGLEVDHGTELEPGEPGTRKLASTAFGQGAARMHPMEAARMTALVASGGIYRKCPPSMLLGAPCEERRLISEPRGLAPVVTGMRRVVESGTARRMQSIPGVRIYGKTGTATDPGRRDEEPYGIRRGRRGVREHSWFVAFAEPESAPSCNPQTGGRLAVAAVVPRGGAGAGPALAIARDAIAAARGLGYLTGP